MEKLPLALNETGRRTIKVMRWLPLHIIAGVLYLLREHWKLASLLAEWLLLLIWVKVGLKKNTIQVRSSQTSISRSSSLILYFSLLVKLLEGVSRGKKFYSTFTPLVYVLSLVPEGYFYFFADQCIYTGQHVLFASAALKLIVAESRAVESGKRKLSESLCPLAKNRVNGVVWTLLTIILPGKSGCSWTCTYSYSF